MEPANGQDDISSHSWPDKLWGGHCQNVNRIHFIWQQTALPALSCWERNILCFLLDCISTSLPLVLQIIFKTFLFLSDFYRLQLTGTIPFKWEMYANLQMFQWCSSNDTARPDSLGYILQEQNKIEEKNAISLGQTGRYQKRELNWYEPLPLIIRETKINKLSEKK